MSDEQTLEGLSLDRLQNFRAVADAGSIASVTQNGKLKQPVISRQIRELEEYFGVDLFRPSGRNIVLTDAGRRLASIVRQQFNELADFRSAATTKVQRYSVAGSNTLLTWLFAPRLPLLMQSLPNVTWTIEHLRAREVEQGVRAGRYDFGLVSTDKRVPDLQQAELGTLRWQLYIPAKFKIAAVDRALNALALPIGGDVRESVEAWCRQKGKTMRVVMGCTSFSHALAAVASGASASVLPEICAGDLVKAGIQTIPLPGFSNATRTIRLIYTKRMMSTRSDAKKVIGALARNLNIA